MDNGVDVHNRHYSVPIPIVIWFKHPQAIVWVGVSEGLAIFVNEGTFKCLLSVRVLILFSLFSLC